MKCSKGCEGWTAVYECGTNFQRSYVDQMVHRLRLTDCPWCGSPLIEEPMMITRTVTYPAPVCSPLDLGQSYYYPYFADKRVLSVKTHWADTEFDRVMLAHGLIYLIEEHAIQRAKTMIGEGYVHRSSEVYKDGDLRKPS